MSTPRVVAPTGYAIPLFIDVDNVKADCIQLAD